METNFKDDLFHYSPEYNIVLVSVAYLHPPFYDGTVDPARNFGTLGHCLGHELIHALDYTRSMHKDENLLVNSETKKRFQSLADDLINQYSSFTVKKTNRASKKVNGKMTLDENIADNGVAIAWDAYTQHMYNIVQPGEKHVRDPEKDQLFFLSFAQNWCNNPKDPLDELGNVHAPSKIRVNGVVMNNADFSKVFECERGTPMHPLKRHGIW